MTMQEIKQKLKGPEYDFLRTNKHLGDNIIFLTISGSHAHGTNTETSDLDIRGIALNSKEEILLGKDFGQVIDIDTDTIIYSTNKAIFELSNSNPNFLEILFVNPDQIIYMSELGELLYNNRQIFLSKDCYSSFVEYAKNQLRQLQNKTIRSQKQSERELHILNRVKNASKNFIKFFTHKDDTIKLYVDTSTQEDMETEIFMDVHLTHYPLRDYKKMWEAMNSIVKEYNKVGKRAKHAILHEKVNKHSGHLVRLLLECIQILETGTFSVYCEQHIPLLKSIKNKKYMLNNFECSPEFFQLIEDLENKANNAFKNSIIAEHPDFNKINKLLYTINEKIVKNCK